MPDAEVCVRPLADGGEGTVEALALGMGGQMEKVTVTGGAVNMSIEDRMKLIPFEACIGLTSTIVSVVIFLI